jgi:hypothetical protein
MTVQIWCDEGVKKRSDFLSSGKNGVCYKRKTYGDGNRDLPEVCEWRKT